MITWGRGGGAPGKDDAEGPDSGRYERTVTAELPTNEGSISPEDVPLVSLTTVSPSESDQ